MPETRDVLALIDKLLRFPYPQICRHLVMCDLISLLEASGLDDPLLAELADAVVQSQDDVALARLGQLCQRVASAP